MCASCPVTRASAAPPAQKPPFAFGGQVRPVPGVPRCVAKTQGLTRDQVTEAENRLLNELVGNPPDEQPYLDYQVSGAADTEDSRCNSRLKASATHARARRLYTSRLSGRSWQQELLPGKCARLA